MKSKFLYISVLSSMMFFSACGGSKVFSPDTSDSKYIKIGNGGGFTGKTTSYFVLDNGDVYKKSSIKDAVNFVGNIDKSIVTQQWKTYKLMKLNTVKINDPGNMYFFLDFKNGQESNEMTWGGDNIEMNIIAKTMYLNLINKVKDLNLTISRK